jgi:hypothetical protein
MYPFAHQMPPFSQYVKVPVTAKTIGAFLGFVNSTLLQRYYRYIVQKIGWLCYNIRRSLDKERVMTARGNGALPLLDIYGEAKRLYSIIPRERGGGQPLQKARNNLGLLLILLGLGADPSRQYTSILVLAEDICGVKPILTTHPEYYRIRRRITRNGLKTAKTLLGNAAESEDKVAQYFLRWVHQHFPTIQSEGFEVFEKAVQTHILEIGRINQRAHPARGHYWIIEASQGPKSSGYCKLCGATRDDFANSIPEDPGLWTHKE